LIIVAQPVFIQYLINQPATLTAENFVGYGYCSGKAMGTAMIALGY
jgi:hypothetical protein